MNDLPRKPNFGGPCNGCGACCIATPCGLALDYLEGAEEGSPCPALEWKDGRAWCGLALRPFHHSAGLQALALITSAPESVISQWVLKMLQDDESSCDSGRDDGEEDFAVGMTAPEFYHAWHVEGRR